MTTKDNMIIASTGRQQDNTGTRASYYCVTNSHSCIQLLSKLCVIKKNKTLKII